MKGSSLFRWPVRLQTQIFLLVLGIIIVSVGLQTLVVKQFLEASIADAGAKKVMRLASEAAKEPELVVAFGLPSPSLVIQPWAERMRRYGEVSFVTVFNRNAVRYSHPLPEQLGKLFAGGDEKRVLQGQSYVSQGVGTLGLSVRAFVPIYGPSGEQVGGLAVGLLVNNLKEEAEKLDTLIYAVTAASLLLGMIGAFSLSRSIKRVIFDLEPHQIASLLEERTVVISSIKEGVLAIDRDGRVILINDSAKDLLGVGAVEGRPVAEVIPNTLLPEVLETGVADFDRELNVGSRVLLVNRIPLVSRGHRIGVVATFRDLSELRSLTAQLTEVRRYTEALRAQHHEFLNKLHVVSGLIQLGNFEEATRFIVQTVSSRQKTFDDLRRMVEVPDVAALILAKMNEAQEAGIEVHLEPGSRLVVLRPEAVDSAVTIVGNLLQNAIEALRPSSLPLKRIDISLRCDQEVMIRIRDNGSLAPGMKERLFEPGVTTKQGNGNMGIGLHLVKMNVERWGGRVDLDDSDAVTWTAWLGPSVYPQ